ncbi:hypothetical protein K458DRAFT_365146 [Lentithecium fluviatile CBS 122367]|uniref:Mg2+ transporter protein n=1 Tax=Lentithecium fluviatile CBS 122367 TaxID=1168545 RepID=A0A6G1J601_9PLEO|nr:hypothetical protein K458DRAFT_365146 [Lentithecium fluviatile CBS 122367]
MRVPASRSVGFDTLSLAHSHSQNVTNVVYYSLENENNIFNALLEQPGRCLQPTFFAAVLYRCHQQRVEIFRRVVDSAVITIEERSRFGGPGRLFGRQFGIDEPETESNSESMTKRLSYVQTELAIAGHLARTSVKCGEWLVKVAENDTREWEMDNVTQTLDEMEYVKRRAETVVSQLQSIQDRVQSQITFLLNTAAQNQSNYTATIALETRRDSAAMKTIAVLTILFLPGTFVATLFSMDMFQWQPDNGAEPTVSKMFWVYWIVTAPLTTLVMMIWLLWTRKSVRKLRSWERRGVENMEPELGEKRE